MVYRKNPMSAEELRRLANERFHSREKGAAASWTPSEIQGLLEELEVRQIELELQNEHLNAMRVQLETALDQSSELYDFAPVGILTLDPTGSITKLNLAGARLLGGERARLLGSRFGLFLAAAERPAFNALLELAMSSGEAQGGEMLLARPGLPEAHVQIWIAAPPQALDCQAILVDITERKQIEERLHASEERWKLALEAAGDGVWDWNVQTGEVVFSGQFEQLLGFSEGEYGRHTEDWTSRIHPDDQPQVMADLQAHLSGKTARFFNQHREQCKDGSWKWILSRGAVVGRNEDGKALRMISTHVDITARKKTEEALTAATQLQQTLFDSFSTRLREAELANTDALTGALSRENFLALAEQELTRSTRYKLPLMALMLDLDHFKRINDCHGHAAGNAVLQGFAQTVHDVLRESDLMGRIGGEEFAVLLPNTTLEGGRALAQRILETVRASPVEVDGRKIGYTTSIGGGCRSSETSFPALLQQADAALYRAKSAGRDRLELGLA